MQSATQHKPTAEMQSATCTTKPSVKQSATRHNRKRVMQSATSTSSIAASRAPKHQRVTESAEAPTSLASLPIIQQWNAMKPLKPMLSAPRTTSIAQVHTTTTKHTHSSHHTKGKSPSSHLMKIKPLAQHHPATALLQQYEEGFPVNCGTAWTEEHIKEGIMKSYKDSTMSSTLMRTEMMKFDEAATRINIIG